MRVILLAKKLFFFDLPDKVNGSYWMPLGEDSDERLVNIEANDDHWIMKGNDETKIQENGIFTEEVSLQENTFYSLVRNGEQLVIYTTKTYDDTFSAYNLPAKYTFKIGNSPDCEILYNIQYLNGVALVIDYDGQTRRFAKAKNALCFVNNNLYTEENGVLQNGDTLFLYGLQILIVNNMIMINNPNNSVGIDERVIRLVSPVGGVEDTLPEVNEKDLYEEKDYYLKSPRINRTIDEKELKLSRPPASPVVDEQPFIFTVGPMLATACVSLVSVSNTLTKVLAGEVDMEQCWPQFATAGLMLLSTLLWPLLSKTTTRRLKATKEDKRTKKYTEYLTKKTQEIQNEIKNEEFILNDAFPSYKEAYQIIMTKDRRLWERKNEQKDFLQVKLGVGDIPSKIKLLYQAEDFSMDEDDLSLQLEAVAKSSEILKSVPVTYSFRDNRISAIMGNNTHKEYLFIKSLIVQLMAYHSYDELKFVVITDKKHLDFWEKFKNMPYCFSNDKSVRYFSSNREERTELNKLLLETFKLRSEEAEDNKNNSKGELMVPHYLILTDSVQEALKLDFFNFVLNAENDICCSVVMIEDKISQLPNKCVDFISLGSGTSDVFKIEADNNFHQSFKDELDQDFDIGKCAAVLSNVPIKFSTSNRYLPNSMNFLEMYHVGKVEQLNLLSRWKQNNPINSIKAQIGVNDLQEPIYLDLHEKAHGPHGLIAGTTGSGKSEFIITYILSMAINYSPEEVSFILIDYKGGGLVGAFANEKTGLSLPHLAGKITNLDKAEMNRTLVSIDSELRRRQQVFNEARDSLGESTIDIYKYQRLYREGKLKEPVSHLFIISDEFAELKSQQPEFMDNLISAARIGRSLGVHLILATQKPTGVVNDQIWSNTKFRVCLKVQDKSDSNEMIKCPDAAEIKQAGRFYLQVGNNEIFVLGQSGWAGAPYYPNEFMKKEYDRSVVFINNVGDTIERAENDSNKKVLVAQGDELTNIVKFIIDTADKENLKARKMWLEKIPPIIYVNNLINKYIKNVDKTNMVAILGELDDPNNQLQDILTIPISQNGNTLIYSISGSDREMAIKSLIYSTSCIYSTKDINWYVIDYGSEALRMFQKLPHVGDMVFNGEHEKMTNLFKMIDTEIEERKKKFINYAGSYQQFIKQSGETVPLIGIVINDFDAIQEDNADFQETVAQYARDCERYGIFFILTCSGYSSLRGKAKQCFQNIMVLEMNSRDDYTNIVGNWKKVCLFDFPGRGLVKKEEIYEFQTATMFPEKNFQEYMESYLAQAKAANPTRAKRIPILPDVISMSLLKDEMNGLDFIPLGMSKSTLETVGLNLKDSPNLLICSSELAMTKNSMKFILTEIKSTGKAKVFGLDPSEVYADFSDLFDQYLTKDFDSIAQNFEEFANQAKQEGLNVVVVMGEPGRIKVKAPVKELTTVSNYIKAADHVKCLFGVSPGSKGMDFDAWYSSLINKQDGLWIGDGFISQDFIRVNSLDKSMRQPIDEKFAWRVKGTKVTLIKLIDSEARDEDE